MKFIKVFILVLLAFTVFYHSPAHANPSSASAIESEQTKNMENPPVIEAQEKSFNIFSIEAQEKSFNIFSLVYTLKGDVHIRHKNRAIRSDFAEYKLTSQEVKARGNIEFSDNNFSATCDELYAPTRADRVDLIGNVTFQKGNITVHADRASFNWKSKIATFEGNVNANHNGEIKDSQYLQYNVATGQFI